MSDVLEKVRETLATVAGEVTVPPFDEVAFRAQVRRARRRRTGPLVVGGVAAAAVLGAALATVPPLLEDDRSGSAPPVTGKAARQLDPGVLPEPLYYSTGTSVTALTPDGTVHDLGPAESVVGSTAEGVLVTDTESRLVWIAARSSGEGDGAYTFARDAGDAGPVSIPWGGPVQSVALSADGRYLAWLDLEDWVTVWDLKADRLVQSRGAVENSQVTSVSDRGVLVSLNGKLTFFGTEFDLGVPVEGDGYGSVSDTVGDFVAVADRDDVTRLYDVTREVEDGVAPLVDTVPGTGRLAPYARSVVSVEGATVRLYAEGEPRELTGLEGTPQSTGWLDEDHAVVTAAEATGTVVYLCPVADAACTPVAFSKSDVRLGE